MATKDDFLQLTQNLIAKYPAIALLYNAGDPALLWMIESNATMLAALSTQLDVAQAEPFEKVRDATVLADAAMRGIILKGKPSRVQILVKNASTAPFAVASGRIILDSKGNYYLIETAVVINADSSGLIEASQIKVDFFSHTVAGNVPFYAVEIPQADDGSYLSGIYVSDDNGVYEYRNRYVNSFADERIYNVEMDDRQRIYVRFGQANIVGTQPPDGTLITLTLTRTMGEITPPALGEPFSFDYLSSTQETQITLTMQSLLFAGENPIDMATLRDLAKYPSVYDHNAVYLGEFDFLVRVNFPDVQFLSVWNESIEETVRGANVDHINTLFVAVLSKTGNEQVLEETNTPITPVFIAASDYTGTQKAIIETIAAADDSYRVKFYTPVISKIKVDINVVISTSYVAGDVTKKITAVLLENFGKASPAAQHGSNQPLYREVYDILKINVPELSDGRADLQVNIDSQNVLRPELWRYIAEDSLTVTVNSANIIQPSWGGGRGL